MRIVRSLICLCVVLVAVSTGAAELLHRSTVQGLSTYSQLSPIVSPTGSYHGFVAADAANDRIAVYDSAGFLIHTYETVNNARMAIARLSDDGDTLVVYALEDTTYAWTDWDNYDLLRVTMIEIVDEQVVSETHRPDCFPGYGTEPPGINALIEFKLDNQYRPTGLTFRLAMYITAVESTQGTRTELVSTFIEYSLDLSSIVVRTSSNDFVSAYFGGPDTCGVAKFCNYYSNVNDDPWNSGITYATSITVANCAETLFDRYVSNTGSSRFYAGDFKPGIAHDEIIFVGTLDLLGVRETQAHWACYSIEGNVLTEEWRIAPPWQFAPQSYLGHRNAIIGIVNGLWANLVDCETGAYLDSFPLAHVMNDKAFLLTNGTPVPDIFGRLGDTVFVYDLDAPTDVDPAESGTLPGDFVLHQNYPNPFNPTTTIRYGIPSRARVKIEIFNVLGQEVRTLVDAVESAGAHQVEWNGTDRDGESVSSGVYLYRLSAGDSVKLRKMLLLK